VLEDVVGAMKRGGVQITGDDHRCALRLDEGVDRFRLTLTFTDCCGFHMETDQV